MYLKDAIEFARYVHTKFDRFMVEFRRFGKNLDSGVQIHLQDFTTGCVVFRSCGVTDFTDIWSTKEAGEFSVFHCEIANKVKD